jgi:ER lumen protein retaining receptor
LVSWGMFKEYFSSLVPFYIFIQICISSLVVQENRLTKDKYIHMYIKITWTFSIILESVCVLPQLLLLRQTTVPTVIDSYYLVTLGSYRALYILNWLVRGFGPEKHWDPIPDFFGVVQTALYVDFAWVYYSRQRVKLRNGGIVDSDDFRKGWLLRGLTLFR